MEIRENLELVEVVYENNEQKAVLTFLDAERGEVRVVNFNKQVFKDGKFVADEEKAAKVDDWCEEFFSTSFDRLTDCLGSLHTVYCYERFNSLFETETVAKFSKEDCGEVIETVIEAVKVDDVFIRIQYKYNGSLYESKMSLGKYIESVKKWFVDPQVKAKKFEMFLDKFGVPVDRASEIVGKKIFVEVKSAFGTNYYGDIKKLPKN